MFAQAVYLMLPSVYVCKETVEHWLSAGNGEGDHGDDEVELRWGMSSPRKFSFNN
jgi:hypothetical protein